MEVLRMATVGFKIFPKAEDKIVDGSGGRIYLIAPYYL
jgi:hypothetical protein